MFPISEYEWSDTSETIADYYARHSQNATDRQRFLCSKKFMVGLILLSAIISAAALSMIVANNTAMVRVLGLLGGLLVGAIAGMAVFVSIYANPIKHKVCGVSDTRLLK